jgi:hypothetical protein
MKSGYCIHEIIVSVSGSLTGADQQSSSDKNVGRGKHDYLNFTSA